MTDSFRLENKIALVTGGASGIGAATARELARAGAHVLIADVNLAAAESLAAELPNAQAVAMDVTDAASIASALANISQLDILVNNAGIGLVGDITRTSEEDFARVMKVNVHSVFLVTQAAFALLLASHGSIVNIGSVAATCAVLCAASSSGISGRAPSEPVTFFCRESLRIRARSCSSTSFGQFGAVISAEAEAGGGRSTFGGITSGERSR